MKKDSQSHEFSAELALDRERNKLALEQALFAVERTFLAWVRTGMTSVGLGIAIARFVIFKNINHEMTGHRIGQLMVLWGVGVFIFALLSYNKSYSEIAPNKAKKQLPFIGLTFATIVLIGLSFLLFWIIIE